MTTTMLMMMMYVWWFSYRLNKLKFFLFLHFLYFENVLEGRVIKELSLLINLCVSLRMSKQTRVTVITKAGFKLWEITSWKQRVLRKVMSKEWRTSKSCIFFFRRRSADHKTAFIKFMLESRKKNCFGFTSWRYDSFFLEDKLRCLSSVE